MNLTVGPLPPAVYWRRRALVLGAVVALVFLLVTMCGGSGRSNPAAIRPAATATSTRMSPTPTTSVQQPIVGAPGGASGSAPPPGGTPSGAGTSPTARSDMCSDAEIQLTPSIQKITGGTYPYQLQLDIKNISNRTCKRDDGANPQEMHIVNSAGQTVWSSDYCQSNPGSNVATFDPNIVASFKLPWDGYGYGPGCARGAKLADGSYQLVAKLDTKVSAPVAFTIGGK
jgi:hypothetical protein